MNPDALESFAAARPAKAKPAWSPPTMASFVPGGYLGRHVFAFDPSLSGCAGVFLSLHGRIGTGLGVQVHAARKFATSDHGAGGYEESLRKALELSAQVEEWIFDEMRGYSSDVCEFVHEGPPVGGGSLIRPEATLLGGAAVRFALDRRNRRCAPMVQPQAHKAFVCGPGARKRGFGKKEHHAVLMPWAASLGVTGLELVTNADLRDALSVALTHLSRPVTA